MKRGFTLLEMLVATLIMGIAVVGLLSNISTSMRNGARVIEQDRVVMLARRTMDALLVDDTLPYDQVSEGRFDPAKTGVEGGWRARLTRFEEPPGVQPGMPVLDRIELEVWWRSGPRRRSLQLEAYRRGMAPLPPAGGGGAP